MTRNVDYTSIRKFKYLYMSTLRASQIRMCIAVLFTLKRISSSKTWKQAKCSPIEEWVYRLWYNPTREYYSAKRRNELLTHGTWLNLSNIIMSKRPDTRAHTLQFHIFECKQSQKELIDGDRNQSSGCPTWAVVVGIGWKGSWENLLGWWKRPGSWLGWFPMDIGNHQNHLNWDEQCPSKVKSTQNVTLFRNESEIRPDEGRPQSNDWCSYEKRKWTDTSRNTIWLSNQSAW